MMQTIQLEGRLYYGDQPSSWVVLDLCNEVEREGTTMLPITHKENMIRLRNLTKRCLAALRWQQGWVLATKPDDGKEILYRRSECPVRGRRHWTTETWEPENLFIHRGLAPVVEMLEGYIVVNLAQRIGPNYRSLCRLARPDDPDRRWLRSGVTLNHAIVAALLADMAEQLIKKEKGTA
ncbi:MAG: hypothetical protein LW713_00645 [Acetobacteraceae bacterium]|jgi:hypothetical protein|nr:hypothetical protein [Acetobacteraceae bacterium]